MDIKNAFMIKTPTFDYESPITRAMREVEYQMQQEDDALILKAVMQKDIFVDKEELIKALQYDRDQYEKGFQDGYNCPKWIPVSEKLPEQAGKYLVTVQNGNVYAGTFDAYSGRFQCAAIAWMPLPTPYKAESEEQT